MSGAKPGVYLEKQIGALCGQHALNNLCQGPYFTLDALVSIAHELDASEREVMLAAGVDTRDALEFIADGSSNIDESGNLSLNVLNVALTRRFGVSLVHSNHPLVAHRMQRPECVRARLPASARGPRLHRTRRSQGSMPRPLRRAARLEQGFLCNLQNHWTAIRRVGARFWSLNSMSARPEPVSDFHLSAYLSQLVHEGWSVFLATGPLPPGLQVRTRLLPGRPHARSRRALAQDPSAAPPAAWHPMHTLLHESAGAAPAPGADDDGACRPP